MLLDKLAAAMEDLHLRRHHRVCSRTGLCERPKLLGKAYLGRTVPLGGGLGHKRKGFSVLRSQTRNGRGCRHVSKLDQNLPRQHMIPVLGRNFVDDPAFEMLDQLAMGIDADDTRRDHGATDGGAGQPHRRERHEPEKG